ncbi:MAG: MerR family transcriptional regulator [Bacteroidaceae bacterium]|nr:MerR family transcriptional regulator [Bacteroidaceae bacterium]
MPLIPNKNLKTYFSIGEVAKMFDVSESLLRFWEKEFPTIQPRKSGRNIRQYTAEDIDEINIVYNLVKVRGMKISAARETVAKNHDKEVGTSELLDRLLDIRKQLLNIKKELKSIV